MTKLLRHCVKREVSGASLECLAVLSTCSDESDPLSEPLSSGLVNEGGDCKDGIGHSLDNEWLQDKYNSIRNMESCHHNHVVICVT